MPTFLSKLSHARNEVNKFLTQVSHLIFSQNPCQCIGIHINRRELGGAWCFPQAGMLLSCSIIPPCPLFGMNRTDLLNPADNRASSQTKDTLPAAWIHTGWRKMACAAQFTPSPGFNSSPLLALIQIKDAKLEIPYR